MIERVMRFEVTMQCCRDGKVVYSPVSKIMKGVEIKEEFDESLVIWNDKNYDLYYNLMYEQAKNSSESKCNDMGSGSLRLCRLNFVFINVDERVIK